MIDNHTSNGADYQYTMTMVAPQKDKLDPSLADYLTTYLMPQLEEGMQQQDWDLVPYVNVRNTPDKGIYGFLDLPRYSSGYAALRQCLAFMPETHMLKPYEDRVWSTYAINLEFLRILHQDAEKFGQLRAKARREVRKQETFAINWELDQSQVDSINFKGYTAKYKPSAVTGMDRLYYDREEPWQKHIPFYNTYAEKETIDKPIAYIIPQGYTAVIERLQWNQVQMERTNRGSHP